MGWFSSFICVLTRLFSVELGALVEIDLRITGIWEKGLFRLSWDWLLSSELSVIPLNSSLIFLFWRALKTINIREESEKLNIWVAYFNLENEYGNPPEVKNFFRALRLHRSCFIIVIQIVLRVPCFNFYSGGCWEIISQSSAVLWYQKGAPGTIRNVWKDWTTQVNWWPSQQDDKKIQAFMQGIFHGYPLLYLP